MKRSTQRGGVLSGILAAFVIFVGLGVIAAFFVARNVRVTERISRGETTVETPFGSVRVRENSKLDPRHLGVPVYPGAVREDDHRKLASFEFDLGSSHKEFVVVAAEYTTSDSVDQVREFYRRELPHWLVSGKRHGGCQIEFTEEGYKKIIAIRDEHGRTHIGLASVGEPAAN